MAENTPDTTAPAVGATDTTTPTADAPQELTTAQLKKQNEQLTRQLTSLTTAHEKLKGTHEELKSAHKEKTSELKQAEAIIDEQTQKLAVADAKGGDAVIVTHERKQYRVIGKQLNVEGHVHTAESLTKNPDVVAQLVRSESGFLQLVSK